MVRTGLNRRLEWVLGALTVAAVVLTGQGHRRLSIVAEDTGFGALVVLAVVFVAMAWWGLLRAWKDREVTRWRAWLSLAGCIALFLAFAMLWIPMLFFFWGRGFMDWDNRTLWIVSALLALLAGVLGARPTRFPLILGGLMMTSVVMMIPGGVL
jgi:hypothetical protein